MNLKRTKGDLLIRRQKHIGVLCNNELGENEINLTHINTSGFWEDAIVSTNVLYPLT